MRIAYLCQRIPYPPNRGDRIVAYNQIRHLSRRHEVVVASLASGDSNGDQDGIMEELEIRLIAPRQGWFRRMAGMTASLMTGEPLTLGYFRNQKLRSKIDILFKQTPFDAIVVYSSSMAQYVEHIDRMPRIMHFCDVDSQKWLDLAVRCTGPMRWIYSREGRLLLQYERKIAAKFDAACVVTRHEAEVFRKCIPGIPVQVLENGVNYAYFSGIPRRPVGLRFVFVGVMDYPPNEEAVTFFAEKVWPKVLSAYPGARFSIVGSRPSRVVRCLAAKPGIEVTGHVPDIRPFLSAATLMVAPLEIARGVQNKILEAMAAGLPVLTTPIVAKGLPQGAGDVIFSVGRDPMTFSSVLLALISNPELREAKAVAAQDYVRRTCSWDKKLRDLDLLLEKVVHRHKANLSARLKEAVNC